MSWKLIGGCSVTNVWGFDIYRNEEEDVWGVKPWKEDADIELADYDEYHDEPCLIWGGWTIPLGEVQRAESMEEPKEDESLNHGDTEVTINAWALRDICIKHNWFTCGTSTQYSKLFDKAAEGATIHDLALIIWLCSDEVPMAEIKEELRIQVKLRKNHRSQ